ncbi:site-specific DNA methylase [Neoasaia chiangmaiensis NBRC 101099]|uniref:site-specific DNA-methyltransferase (adenine-specific) n=1 Tax=Neoasaia chiangmaiensis TaxID=320497 RepID=A0A1U9KR83_9PROT|nr:DNA adenine methylase [Neoasaia chiangmaiensis]AQS88257.1 DNA methyltransferase [Neoasaia chiangmaiensis]GBR39716.1 site-specific DNA methylase [Neoasaia chiangmaiensis NBRC 101099]GEN14709.1 DNA methyltransferase [Neoasaia chiangmaiensis]
MVNNWLTPADPAAPVAPYLGGKRNLARIIVQKISAIEHTTYVEPFVGMGGVFLRRPFRAKAEVINDISRDVSNLFRILQRHYVALMDLLRFQITSRSEFERLVAAKAETLTDLERAARFLYLQRLAFGGKISGRNFGVDVARPARFDVARLGPLLDEVHQRLSGVVVECLPFERVISVYDRPGTLFYLDPPYFGCEKDYGPNVFHRDDFERLSGLLAQIKGRFLLSLNDRPEVRAIFSRFTIEPVTTSYGVGKGSTAARELLISGPEN